MREVLQKPRGGVRDLGRFELRYEGGISSIASMGLVFLDS